MICLGAPKDHETTIGLGELGVVLWGGVRWFTSLWGCLLGLVLMVEGVTNVAPDGGAVLEELICLPSYWQSLTHTFNRQHSHQIH